jgi:hypothetical protein
MRRFILTATLVLLSSSAWAQQQTPDTAGAAIAPATPAAAPPPSMPITGAAPAVGGPQNPGTTVGMSRSTDDGSTETVRAVPCTRAARETDGSTTCVGIPDRGPGRFPR